jgi:hypothetical protein
MPIIPDLTRLFPVILIALDVLAAIPYLCAGDIRHCLCWLFAAGFTICITF